MYAIIIIKTIALIIGFSSALINDILTFKFLKDFKITEKEYRSFFILAGINLFSALTVAITFIISIIYELSFVNNELLISSSIILGFIVFNEIFFRRIIIPKLMNSRINPKIIDVQKTVLLRKIAYFFNTISFITWLLLLLIFQFGLLSN